MSRQNFKLPNTANERVKKLWDDMVALSLESGALRDAYHSDLVAFNEGYGMKFVEISNRMREIKQAGMSEICKIAGVDYDPLNGYALEATYLEFGHAYMTVQKPDDEGRTPEEKALLNMELPPGGKAN